MKQSLAASRPQNARKAAKTGATSRKATKPRETAVSGLQSANSEATEPRKTSTVTKRKYVAVNRMSYTPDIAEQYCGYIAQGMSLRTACLQPGMPAAGTVFNWFSLHPSFVELYARAKEQAADAFLEDIQDIADKTLRGEYNAKAAKVAIDAKIWAASKLKPKKYGERLDLTSNGNELQPPNIYLPAELPYNAAVQVHNTMTHTLIDGEQAQGV